MACPGGCIGGGGQPKSDDPLVLLKRMGAGEGVEGSPSVREMGRKLKGWRISHPIIYPPTTPIS